MPVISGGLLLSPAVTGTGVEPGGYGRRQFLAGHVRRRSQSSMDALGVHVYPSDYVSGRTGDVGSRGDADMARPDRRRALGRRRGLAADLDHRDGHLDHDRAGWPAATTPQQQATDLSQMIQIARANPSIRTAIIHGLEDQSLGYNDPDNAVNAGWGIFSSDGTAKPAACAVSRLFDGSLTC